MNNDPGEDVGKNHKFFKRHLCQFDEGKGKA